jgi:hypothetical protein
VLVDQAVAVLVVALL